MTKRFSRREQPKEGLGLVVSAKDAKTRAGSPAVATRPEGQPVQVVQVKRGAVFGPSGIEPLTREESIALARQAHCEGVAALAARLGVGVPAIRKAVTGEPVSRLVRAAIRAGLKGGA